MNDLITKSGIGYIRINKYLPFAFIYFFFNSVALPFGLTWMALLAPFFYVWILLTRKKEVLLPFLVILLPFIIMHIYIVGVDLKTYMISLLSFTLVYIFCQAFYTFLKNCHDLEKIFRILLIVNFFFCLIAIILFFTPYYEIFWIEQEITRGIKEFKRLNLLTYEASYYATLITPIFFFFLLQYFFHQNTIRSGWLLLMIFLPYILSFSIGVIGCILFSVFITWTMYFSRLTPKRRVINFIIYIGAIMGAALIIIVRFFRHNPVFTRLDNIFSGQDLSGRARTEDAYIIAGKILDQGNKYWGVGLGQVKIAGADIIREYYLYSPWHPVAIPNAVAETLAIFGWLGLFLRFGLIIFLFFFTKVWTNYFRMLLFIFIFIFQFGGSFITNMAEYAIWILAFTNVFKQFDVNPSYNLNSEKR